MKVYRYASHQEILQALYNGYEFIGMTKPVSNYKVSSHFYKPGIKYIHFFKKIEHTKYIEEMYKKQNSLNGFLCEYDIPKQMLLPGIGIGRYTDDKRNKTVKLLQFAVPSYKMDLCFLSAIKKSSESEDYLFKFRSNEDIKKAIKYFHDNYYNENIYEETTPDERQ